MPPMKAPLLAWLAVLAAPEAGEVFEKAADSVVAVRALAPLGERSGTGAVISKDGLILTSSAVCPGSAAKIRVWVRGPRLYDGELVAVSEKDELALVRIRPEGDLKPVEFGESGRVRVGDPSYTIGNAANSMILDDQPSFHAGVVSGIYRLDEARAHSTYAGPVIETSAAVNVGMEGAPCLDAQGRMVGFITLNYSPNRFLGAAIPIDEIKQVIERLQEKKDEKEEAAGGQAFLGLTAKEEGGKVVVAEVRAESPVGRAGLAPGDVLLEVGSLAPKTAREIDDWLKGMQPGAVVWIKFETGGEVERVKITLEKKE